MVTDLMKYNPAFLTDEALIRSFVARTTELERILEVLRENTGRANQHLLVIGPRGIGKTTLVLRTAAEIRAQPALDTYLHPIVYGEETYQVSSAGEFWVEALFHVGQQTGDARWQQAHDDLLRERDEQRLRSRALAQLMDFADQQGKRLVLVVENLNMLFGGQIGEADAWVLRHTLMNEPRIMLIGTATSRFQVMDEYNQALYELFRIIELEPLADEEAQAVWTAASGQTAPRHQLRPIQILTGGNPRLIRILSEFAAKTSFRSLMNDLTRLVDEHTEYFKHHLDNLPPQERKIFVVLADLWDPSTARQVAEAARLDVNATSAQLKRLIARGAVATPYKQGRSQYYQVAERMYNIYHLMRRRGQPSSRVHAVVRFMVSLYRDDELIQTTQSLAEEAVRLTADQRREHFIAYEAILVHTREPQLTKQLIAATRHALEAMPDVPFSILRLIDPNNSMHEHIAPILNAPASASLIGHNVADLKDIQTLFQIADARWTREQVPETIEVLEQILAIDPQNDSAWLRRGIALSRLDRMEESLRSYDHAIALDDRNPNSWLHRGLALSKLGRLEEAIESFRRAIAIDPDNSFAWTECGMALGDLGRTEEAVESFARSLAIEDDSFTWVEHGEALVKLGRIEEAIDAFNRARANDEDIASVWTRQGIALFQHGRIEDAFSAFDRVVSIDPEYKSGWTTRGLALEALGRVEEALESFDRAIAMKVDDSTTWVHRGIALADLGRMEEALESFYRAITIDPGDGFGWIRLGMTLVSLDRVEGALEAFSRAVSIDRDDSYAWTQQGMALVTLGRTEEALESFGHAVVADPEDSYAWMHRGIALDTLGRGQEALKSFDRAISIDGDDASLWIVRGLALRQLGLVEDALVSFDRALKLDPERASAWANRGAALDELGRGQEALEAVDHAIELDPTNVTAWTNRGIVLHRLRRMAEGLESLDHAVSLHAESRVAWESRSYLLLDMGRTEEAIESFERALSLPLDPALVFGSATYGALDGMAWGVFESGRAEKLHVAEDWARLAIAQDSEKASAHHTLAHILGAQGKWEEAIEEAPHFLRDDDLLDSALDDILDFFIDAAASGHGNGVVKVIQKAEAEDALEPLLVAIRRISGEQVDVAREIWEVSTDVIGRIERRRRELLLANAAE